MQAKWRLSLAAVALFGAVVTLRLLAVDPPTQDQRDKLVKTMNAGNYKDAYEGLSKFALDHRDDPLKVDSDLTNAIQCLQRLGRVEEIDDFREAVIVVHKSNWRLLQTAADTYTSVEHYGYIVAGKFYRGHKRGGGRYVNTFQRDRVRALQLMEQAQKLLKDETDKAAVAQFHFTFAQMLLQGAGNYAPWRLQYLTDLSKLPDYDEGYYYGSDTRGAPVDEQGNPVFHQLPKSYADAASDGERWRWQLAQVVEFAPGRVNEVDLIFANFLHSQFDVQTMASRGGRFGRRGFVEQAQEPKTGTFAVHTLKDDETIAQLASGIKRFTLPDEFNWIKIYERVAARGKSDYGAQARDALANVYEDRRQYEKAAQAWQKAIAEYGAGNGSYRQKRLDQIVGNWGRFETVNVQPAGVKSTVEFRFRNGDKVSFEAHAIKVEKLLEDVKAYLQANPGRLDWERLNIGNIGYRLVEKQQTQYLGDKVASWEVELKPRPAHVDERLTVKTPLDKPGAYLLSGKMANGNLSRVILWVSDTAIVQEATGGTVTLVLR